MTEATLPRQNVARRDALLLVVDDREDNRQAIAEIFERQGYPVLVASGGREALEQLRDHAPDLVICDLKMPDIDGLELLKTARATPNAPEFILLTAFGTVETAVDALKHGAFNYLTKPINPRDLRAQVEKAVEHRRMRHEVSRLRRQVEMGASDNRLPQGAIIESPPMRRLMSMVERLGSTQSNVLIEGESGVGKEIVAQGLHGAQGESDKRPFIAVHCAALPETLLESELFGYERGAFTGAESQHIGRLELADGGTLFLDEVGEIPLAMQVKLLRVLEQRELTRVGGRHVVKVQFRLIAATNRSLEEEVRAGRFREDLYYRLNVVKLVVPPLRERREDILPLFEAFLRRFSADQGTAPPLLTTGVAATLERYAWPGNVRELRNLAERLSIFAAGRELTGGDFPPDFAGQPAGSAGQGSYAPAGSTGSTTQPAETGTLDLQSLERQAIERALGQFQGNRSAAAEALGISRRTLQRKLKEYRMAEEESED
jgi:DNA-binding NtrC family response regulator